MSRSGSGACSVMAPTASAALTRTASIGSLASSATTGAGCLDARRTGEEVRRWRWRQRRVRSSGPPTRGRPRSRAGRRSLPGSSEFLRRVRVPREGGDHFHHVLTGVPSLLDGPANIAGKIGPMHRVGMKAEIVECLARLNSDRTKHVGDCRWWDVVVKAHCGGGEACRVLLSS